jgi:hypothetical protein
MSKPTKKRTDKPNSKALDAAVHGKAVPGKSLPTVPSPSQLKRVEPNSKQSRVIAMLQSPTGASIAAMMKATDWQPHSVRGFLAGVVRKRLKLKLDSQKVDGTRVYRIAGEESRKAQRAKSTRPSS